MFRQNITQIMTIKYTYSIHEGNQAEAVFPHFGVKRSTTMYRNY